MPGRCRVTQHRVSLRSALGVVGEARRLADKAELLRRIAAALSFPDWFGHNWDALADSLEDLSWLPATGYLLLLERAQDWQTQAGDDAAALLDILNEASAQWAEARKPFWALFPIPSERLDAIAP